MRYKWIFVVFLLGSCAYNTTKVHLGESFIKVRSNRKSLQSKSMLFLNLHENEKTSIKALQSIHRKEELAYIYLHQDKKRRIVFSLRDSSYNFDPNRIFTDKGRKETLTKGGNYSTEAGAIVKTLSKRIIDSLNGFKWVIAVHNNTDANYSIKSYSEDGDESANTGELYINPLTDPDDFIYTTDKRIFNAVKSKKINVVLQSSKSFVDDGSLSIYCGSNNIPYVNIETEHGHFEKQIEFISIIKEIIQSI